MTPSEMEEQIKNLNEFAAEFAQILPTLATKEDLKRFATKEDLKAFATKDDVESSKRYTEDHILVVRGEIRQIADQVTSMAADVKSVAEQLALLTTRRKRKKF